MKITKYEFPNPVLAEGRDDYKNSCQFVGVFNKDDIKVNETDIIIPVAYTLKCKGLEKLIKNGDAVAIVAAISRPASYSEITIFDGERTETDIKVPKFSAVDYIDIACSIVAAHDISGFCCEGEFNDVYFRGITFEIRKGDILATEEYRTVFINQDELERDVTSIFRIRKKDSQDYDVIPKFEGDKIEVYVKDELFNLYCRYRDFNNGVLKRYITSVIVSPALTEAVGKVINYFQSEGAEEYMSRRRWFRVILTKAERLGFKLDECPEVEATTVADALLGEIALDALRSLDYTLNSECNNGEIEETGDDD